MVRGLLKKIFVVGLNLLVKSYLLNHKKLEVKQIGSLTTTKYQLSNQPQKHKPLTVLSNHKNQSVNYKEAVPTLTKNHELCYVYFIKNVT